MKTLFLLLTSFLLFFQTHDLQTVRNNYPAANLSKANADSFKTMVAKTSSSDPVFRGYRAASEIISAKFMKGSERKTALTAGIKLLESTIAANPAQAELRFIRFSIQENLPKIVNYRSKITEDKNFILKNYSRQNSGLKNYMREYLKSSKGLTAAEKASLK
ncbi:hypothetical protein [Chryseobacterium sp.]|uniref:hypothetical protein n=1 Tax=Chryseobacterium sp. TaxID=1871047 RepID=UPI0011C91B3E|nr:hypothetical protein [Chryseobacterium sp.]TXF75868.1 hypothetical protein FUA25_08155 [Chryseobacterium sp.]